MQSYSFSIYAPSALDFASVTISLAPGFDPKADLMTLEVRDNDDFFEGDGGKWDEIGSDRSQFGKLFDTGGNPVFGHQSTRVFLEEAHVLKGPDGGTITLYRVELTNREGETYLAGYVSTAPLDPGVAYCYSTVDITEANAPRYDELASIPICFTPGTLIATPAGLRPVETIRPGERVLTRDAGPQEVLWIGHRRYGAAALARQAALRPVLIRAGALGPGLPARDMRLSPQHRLLAGGARCDLFCGTPEALIPARALVGRPGVSVAPPDAGITYIHLLFEDHQILSADGLAAESFHPGKVGLSTLEAAARAELFAIFPGLARDPLAYGPAARPALTMREGRALARAGVTLAA